MQLINIADMAESMIELRNHINAGEKAADKSLDTFAKMASNEPRLVELERQIKQRAHYPCANALWFGRNGFKRQMADIVGHAGNSHSLRSSFHYDIAYNHLYALLPNCNHEGHPCGLLSYEE